VFVKLFGKYFIKKMKVLYFILLSAEVPLADKKITQGIILLIIAK
jgi:hypothetical protein